MLPKITTGKIKQPHLVLIFGTDGTGKTTFGASAPNPIIIGPESGSSNMDVARWEPTTYAQLMEMIEALHKLDHKTAVFDSLDWIEPMVWKAVCEAGKVSSIEDFGGGYGKGYTESLQYWRKMIEAIRRLREEKKMNVVVIAHSQIKAFNDPAQTAPYDRHTLKLNEKASALWREFADTVLFATYEVFVKKEGSNKAKAFGDGARVVYTERRPGFDAKNRFGLPFQLPLSWDDYEKAMSTSKPDLKVIIATMLEEVKDQDLKTAVMKAVEDAKNDSKQLEAIKNRLAIRLGES